MRGELDPGCASLLRALRASGAPPVEAMSPDQARRTMRERREATQLPSQALVQARDLTLDLDGRRLGVRVYRPAAAADSPLPALLYLHGGGWVMGDLEVFDSTLRELCAHSGGAVVALDYRLAPEHPFPAALDDTVAALRWLRAEAGDLGVDATRLAIGGDSAGANLATVCAAMASDSGDPPLALQLLVYPVTDLRGDSGSYAEPADRQLMTAQTMRWFIAQYLGDAPLHADWRVSPLLRPDLAGLPPALVITAGFDPLRDEGRAYADRLSAAGVPVRYVCFERQIHGFFTMSRVTGEADLAVALAAAALREAWAGPPSDARAIAPDTTAICTGSRS